MLECEDNLGPRERWLGEVEYDRSVLPRTERGRKGGMCCGVAVAGDMCNWWATAEYNGWSKLKRSLARDFTETLSEAFVEGILTARKRVAY
jgi:hypothetical protein